MRPARHRERGASLVETAIVMSCLLLLMFGIIDFSRMTYTYSFVANAARMGARWMIVRGSQSCTSGGGAVIDNCNAQPSALLAYVQSLNAGALTASNISVDSTHVWNQTSCPSGSPTKNSPGCTVTVTVSYPFAFIAPYFSALALPMSSTSTMVISQ